MIVALSLLALYGFQKLFFALMRILLSGEFRLRVMSAWIARHLVSSRYLWERA